MGPATAVLVIPSLQWIDTPKIGERQFVSLNSAQPPKNDWNTWFWWITADCSDEQLANQQYSCAYYPFGNGLDQWTSNALASSGVSTSSQDWLTFQGNVTGTVKGRNIWDVKTRDLFFWAPNRQIVSNLSTDYTVTRYLSFGLDHDQTQYLLDDDSYNYDPIETYTEYNISRALEITRNGPVGGAVINVSPATAPFI